MCHPPSPSLNATLLKLLLDEAEDVEFQIKDDLPGLSYTHKGKQQWISIRVFKEKPRLLGPLTATKKVFMLTVQLLSMTQDT